MSAVTFDTYKFIKRLEAAGVPAAQAEALVDAQRDAFSEALDSTLATKADITDVRSDMRELKAEVSGRFLLLQWMIGFNLAFTMALLWKIFN